MRCKTLADSFHIINQSHFLSLPNSEFRSQNSGVRIQNSEFRIRNSEFGIHKFSFPLSPFSSLHRALLHSTKMLPKIFSALTSCCYSTYDNPKRFSLNLGHPFCYNQRNRILYGIAVVSGRWPDISDQMSAFSLQRTTPAISPKPCPLIPKTQDPRPKTQDLST